MNKITEFNPQKDLESANKYINYNQNLIESYSEKLANDPDNKLLQLHLKSAIGNKREFEKLAAIAQLEIALGRRATRREEKQYLERVKLVDQTTKENHSKMETFFKK